MMIFGVCFVLYLIKLSAGKGYSLTELGFQLNVIFLNKILNADVKTLGMVSRILLKIPQNGSLLSL